MAGDKAKPASVLFVCTMNAVRSPMAAALLRHLKGREIYVESAGVEAGALDPLAVEVMAEIGIALGPPSPPFRGPSGRVFRPGRGPVARGPAPRPGLGPHRRHHGGILAHRRPHGGRGTRRAAPGRLPCRAGHAHGAKSRRGLVETLDFRRFQCNLPAVAGVILLSRRGTENRYTLFQSLLQRTNGQGRIAGI